MQKSQDYAGISSESMRLVSLESSERRLDQFTEGNKYVELRMKTMLNSTDTLHSTMVDIKGILSEILVSGTLTDGIDKDKFSEVKMQEIEDFLNVKIMGRHLFSGSKTDTKAIASPVTAGTFATAPTYDGNFETIPEPEFYYRGNDTTLKARVDEGVVLKYGVPASDPAFEKMIRALRILRSTDISGGDANYMAKIQNGFNLITQAVTALDKTELSIGTSLEQLGRTNENMIISKNFLQGISAGIENANTFEAVTAINQDQTMLEASYTTVGRLSQLTLSRFL
jgi:flagellin-like hook-associated protein FlgL